MSTPITTPEVIQGRLYAPMAVTGMLEDLVELYQSAFANAPWNERTQCADLSEPRSGCPGGLSRLAIGQVCEECHAVPSEPAYPRDQLLQEFTEVPDNGHKLWYLETTAVTNEIALAVLARPTTVEGLVETVAEDAPDIANWITQQYTEDDPRRHVVLIEEVFANTDIRPSGNLRNFGAMCRLLAQGSESGEVVLRTMNPKLVSAAKRDFPRLTTVHDPAFGTMPGRAKVVSINVGSASAQEAA